MLEPKGQSMRQLVTALVDALAETLREKPFVVFGHSLGAWMAYEVCVELAQRRGPQPVGLVVSGARAPQLADPKNDADRVQPRMAELPSAAFWAHFERRYRRRGNFHAIDTHRSTPTQATGATQTWRMMPSKSTSSRC